MTLALHDIARPLLYCDISPAAQTVISTNIKKGKLPEAPIIDDVRKLHQMPSLENPDLICAGFPCVGFSTAGQREGFENSQTSIYHELLKVCDRFRPPLVFMENVPQIIREINRVKSDFHAMNYDIIWMVLFACEVGAPQRRGRWYCLAYDKNRIGTLGYVEPMRRLFDWEERTEPTKTTNRKYLPMRVSLLGNSLVPEAARTAFAYLSILAKTIAAKGTLERARPVSEKNRYPKYGFSINNVCYCIPQIWLPRFKVCKPRNLVLDPEVFKTDRPLPNIKHFSGFPTEPVIKEYFATPRFGNGFYMQFHLTIRGCNDLGTQLRFMRCDEPKGSLVNIHFVEWLMGYPRDWTGGLKPSSDAPIKEDSHTDLFDGEDDDSDCPERL